MCVEWLFSAIVIASLLIITLVVLAGGFLVVKDDDYQFDEYLSDLTACGRSSARRSWGHWGRALLPLVAKFAK